MAICGARCGKIRKRASKTVCATDVRRKPPVWQRLAARRLTRAYGMGSGAYTKRNAYRLAQCSKAATQRIHCKTVLAENKETVHCRFCVRRRSERLQFHAISSQIYLAKPNATPRVAFVAHEPEDGFPQTVFTDQFCGKQRTHPKGQAFLRQQLSVL